MKTSGSVILSCLILVAGQLELLASGGDVADCPLAKIHFTCGSENVERMCEQIGTRKAVHFPANDVPHKEGAVWCGRVKNCAGNWKDCGAKSPDGQASE